MDHDLLAYLLQGMEPDEERATEEYLEANPAARKELRQWRKLLDPLNQAPVPEPPSHLYMNTLRAVAHTMVKTQSPNYPARDSGDSGRPRWWRRVDLMVAAGVVIVLLLLLPPTLLYLRHHQAKMACQDNLRQIHQAYFQYCADNKGALPNLAELPEEIRIAGMHPVMLREKNCWRDGITLTCPGVGTNGVLQPRNREEVLKLAKDNTDPRWPQMLGGQYAYPLGYFQGKELRGFNKEMGDETPILADRPPREGEPDWLKANSPNHGGKGQNVLFLGGNVRWLTTRFINDGDDIYLSRNNKLEAGINSQDIVLAPSEARPKNPEPNSD
jgi:hypothetical protein